MPEIISSAEPWLRGVLPDLDPVIGHLMRASQQIREDILRALDPLSEAQVWTRPYGITPVGFHVRHLAGSTMRLCTYLEGHQLSTEQIGDLEHESDFAGKDVLMADVNAALDRYEEIVRGLRPGQFGEIREVGRKKLQTTAIGLAIHIAEHGQRHTGQAISTAKLVTHV